MVTSRKVSAGTLNHSAPKRRVEKHSPLDNLHSGYAIYFLRLRGEGRKESGSVNSGIGL